MGRETASGPDLIHTAKKVGKSDSALELRAKLRLFQKRQKSLPPTKIAVIFCPS